MSRNKQIILLIISLLSSTTISMAAQDFFELPLYSEEAQLKDDISSICVYLPENPNGAAVIVCPGGGYSYLEMNKEGHSFAPWFTSRGIACIILAYRLPKGNSEIPLADAKKSILLVRKYAEEWKLDKQKIGILGSSAGGHLASTLATHFDESTRPNFKILLYPVITMNECFTHMGSRQQLLSENPSKEAIQLYSNELQVTKDTPPAFIVLSDNDNIVPSKNSVMYYLALNQNKVSSEIHIYPIGGHGWGMYFDFKYYSQWTTALESWLINEIGINKD